MTSQVTGAIGESLIEPVFPGESTPVLESWALLLFFYTIISKLPV
jgi:hypothetical protein